MEVEKMGNTSGMWAFVHIKIDDLGSRSKVLNVHAFDSCQLFAGAIFYRFASSLYYFIPPLPPRHPNNGYSTTIFFMLKKERPIGNEYPQTCINKRPKIRANRKRITTLIRSKDGIEANKNLDLLRKSSL